MNRKSIKKRARLSLKDNIGISIVAFLVYLCLPLIQVLIQTSYVASSQPFMAGVIAGLFELFVSLPFAIGLSRFFLEISDDEDARISMLFEGYRHLAKNIWTCVLATIFIIIVTAIGSLFVALGIACYKTGNGSAIGGLIIGFTTIVYAIINLTFSFGITQITFILAEDTEETGMDVIRASMEMMDGYKFEYFIFSLSFILWYLLCIVTLGIAFFYVGPYLMTAYANFYKEVRNKRDKRLFHKNNKNIRQKEEKREKTKKD